MLKRLSFTDKSFPFLLLIVCLLTYGVFMPWLGFYWDDWPVLLMGKFFNMDAFINFYAYDRPFSAWTYIISIPILGLRPVAWQFFTLLLRGLTALFFWLTLRRLWPQQRTQTAWIAVIFLVHPVFTLQFISVAFSQHWISALLYAFSLWAMLNSFDTGKTRWSWEILALASSALHLFTMEYFLGMEVFRYILIWLTRDPHIPRRQQLGVFLRRAAPYAVLLISYIIWRLFLLQLPQEDPNPVRFLQDLRIQPVTGLLTLTQIILRDLPYMLVQSWAGILDSSRVILTSKFFLFSLLFSSFVALVLSIYFLRFASHEAETIYPSSSWASQAMWVGLAATLLGTLPGWVTYRQVLNQPYGNRIVIPALLGLAILIVAFIEWISQNQHRRVILLSVLCGVAVYGHLHTANQYRDIWNYQRSFYWQLYWRVPAVQPGTSFVSDSEVVPEAGAYTTVSAINLMYATEFDSQKLPFWFVNMGQRFQPQQRQRLYARKGLVHNFRSWRFEGEDNAILLVNNSLDGCMQILSANQPENAGLPLLLTQALPLANLDRINFQPGAASPPPAEIFGPEPTHTWCYYYQKADIARQAGDWGKVIALLNEANKHHLEPNKKSEWLLLVDAYVRTGNFAAAEEWTNRIHAKDPRLTQILCTYWTGQVGLPAGLKESISQRLMCSQLTSSK